MGGGFMELYAKRARLPLLLGVVSRWSLISPGIVDRWALVGNPLQPCQPCLWQPYARLPAVNSLLSLLESARLAEPDLLVELGRVAWQGCCCSRGRVQAGAHCPDINYCFLQTLTLEWSSVSLAGGAYKGRAQAVHELTGIMWNFPLNQPDFSHTNFEMIFQG